MTLWRSIRGPLFTWLFLTGMVFGTKIYEQMGRVVIPSPRIPSCEMIEVKYVAPSRYGSKWGFWREQIQCPGPNGKVRVGW